MLLTITFSVVRLVFDVVSAWNDVHVYSGRFCLPSQFPLYVFVCVYTRAYVYMNYLEQHYFIFSDSIKFTFLLLCWLSAIGVYMLSTKCRRVKQTKEEKKTKTKSRLSCWSAFVVRLATKSAQTRTDRLWRISVFVWSERARTVFVCVFVYVFLVVRGIVHCCYDQQNEILPTNHF